LTVIVEFGKISNQKAEGWCHRVSQSSSRAIEEMFHSALLEKDSDVSLTIISSGES
jgi:hypothetical protein